MRWPLPFAICILRERSAGNGQWRFRVAQQSSIGNPFFAPIFDAI
jgi:hypothetical protein